MATSGQVNTNSITTSYGNTWYVETNWWVDTWNSNTATIGWNAFLRRSAGSNSKVNSWGLERKCKWSFVKYSKWYSNE